MQHKHEYIIQHLYSHVHEVTHIEHMVQ